MFKKNTDHVQNEYDTVFKMNTNIEGVDIIEEVEEEASFNENDTKKVDIKEKIPPKKKKSTKEEIPKVSIPNELDTENFRELWTDFIQQRNRSKNPITEIGQKRILNKLCRLGNLGWAIFELERAVIGGWRGVWPDRAAWEKFQAEAPQTVDPFVVLVPWWTSDYVYQVWEHFGLEYEKQHWDWVYARGGWRWRRSFSSDPTRPWAHPIHVNHFPVHLEQFRGLDCSGKTTEQFRWPSGELWKGEDFDPASGQVPRTIPLSKLLSKGMEPEQRFRTYEVVAPGRVEIPSESELPYALRDRIVIDKREEQFVG